MSGVVPTILNGLDALRSIGGILNLRPFTVTVRKRTWLGGSRPGLGQKSDTDIVLQNQDPAGNVWPVLVRYLSNREIAASGGKYRDRDIKVGRMTPTYAAQFAMPAGGYGDAQIDPAPVQSAVELFYLVKGPGYPPSANAADGIIHDKIGEEVTALHYSLVLRSTGRAA